jgi:hypothetical protein
MTSIAPSAIDQLVGVAVDAAAKRMAERSATGERLLEAALDHELVAALEPRWPFGAVHEEGRRRQYRLAGWDPLPGGPDIALYEDETTVAIVEDKWSTDGDNLYELIHDLFKLTGAYGQRRFVAGYLVAGAPMLLWDRPTRCADWFSAEVGGTMTLNTREFLAEHASDWDFILKRSAGQVNFVPSQVELRTVMAVPIEIREKVDEPGPWSVRCLRATPVPGTAEIDLLSV